MVVVAQVLLQRVTLTPAALGKLIGLLQCSADSLSKSSKFAKLLMELCKSPHDQEMVSARICSVLTATTTAGIILL